MGQQLGSTPVENGRPGGRACRRRPSGSVGQQRHDPCSPQPPDLRTRGTRLPDLREEPPRRKWLARAGGPGSMVTRAYVPDAGDLVWLTFDPQAGHEQRGRRPALILSPRLYNVKARLAIACPITSQAKGYPDRKRVV